MATQKKRTTTKKTVAKKTVKKQTAKKQTAQADAIEANTLRQPVEKYEVERTNKPVFNIDDPAHIKNDESMIAPVELSQEVVDDSSRFKQNIDEALSDAIEQQPKIIDYLSLMAEKGDYTTARHAIEETENQLHGFVDGLVRPGPDDDPDMMVARWDAMREQTPMFADTLLELCDGEWAKEMEDHAPGGELFNLVVDEHIDYSASKTLLAIWGGSH